MTFTATITRYIDGEGFTSETVELPMGDDLRCTLPTVKLTNYAGRTIDCAVYRSGNVSCSRHMRFSGITGEGVRVHDPERLSHVQLFTVNSRS